MPLTLHDVRHTLATFRMASKLCMVNFKVHRVTGEISYQKSLWRRLVCRFWALLHICHVSYITLRLIGAVMADEDDESRISWDYLPVVIVDVILYTLIFIGAHAVMDLTFDEFAKFYNEILRIQRKSF